jgi:autotransporter-associated beta strand protein
MGENWFTRAAVGVLLVCATLSGGGSRATAAPPGSGWYLIQGDEFAGAAVDRVKWATQYQWGRTHNHDAYMLDSGVTQSGGILSLTATRQPSNGKNFSSGVISSHDTFRYTYGYAEMRMKLTNKRGSWPAFWMLDSGWPPEIDIMEYPLFVSEGAGVNEDRYYGNSHWNNGSGNQSNGEWLDRNVDLGAGFHTFGLEWTSTNLRYYFDGVLVKTASNQASFQNMYTIFNLAADGWPGAPSQAQWASGTTDVASADWFRVWQKPASGAPADTTWTYNASGTGSWTTDGNWSANQPRYERQRVFFNALAGRSAMQVNWNDSKTVGEVHLNGTTAYTLGAAGGDIESLMFADANDGWASLSVDGGTASHTLTSRLDAWSNLQITNNGSGTLRLNGGVVGQARPESTSPTGVTGGIVRFSGAGPVILASSSSYQRDTRVEAGANVLVTGRLYQENTVHNDAAVRISGGSKLQIANFLGAGATGASLGYLPNEAARVVLDGGTLSLISGATSTRSFTLGAGGGTIEAQTTANVTLADAGVTDLETAAGGALTLTGAGVGSFDKVLAGTGALLKTGSGKWHLGAINSYTGGTQVNEGTLIVDGRTGLGVTGVAAGARLGGGGTVHVLNASGAVAPGNDVGQLNATNATFAPTSILEIELLDLATHDLLNVNQTLAIEPGAGLSVALAPDSPYSPTVGDEFTIVDAAGGITGEFDVLALPELVGFDWEVETTLNEISLTVIAAPFTADFDGNGAVDGADFLTWQRGLGIIETARPDEGDANYDGAVDGADLLVWQEQYVQFLEPPAGAVPEPATAALALAIAAVCGVRRQRA